MSYFRVGSVWKATQVHLGVTKKDVVGLHSRVPPCAAPPPPGRALTLPPWRSRAATMTLPHLAQSDPQNLRGCVKVSCRQTWRIGALPPPPPRRVRPLWVSDR